MDALQLRAWLDLQPHPLEGGYFRRTYQSEQCFSDSGNARQPRYCASSIFYMLSADQPIGFLHRNRSDILHCYQLGEAMEYFLIGEDAKLRTFTLGPDLVNGQVLQLLVPGGVWKASRLYGSSYSLISELVVPGFDYADNELANANDMRQHYEHLYSEIESLIKNST